MSRRLGISLSIVTAVLTLAAAASLVILEPTPELDGRRQVLWDPRSPVAFEEHEEHEQKLVAPDHEVAPATKIARKQDGRAGAGGRAQAHYAGGKAIRSPALAKKAPRTLLFHTGITGAEPTIGITKKGTIFYQGLGFTGPAGLPESHVARSQDNGATWEVVTPMVGPEKRHPVTLDPYLYTDPKTSRTFTFDFLAGCSEISFTDDEGETWTTTPLACVQMDHQTLFAGPPVTSPTVGYPNILYFCAINGGIAVPPDVMTGCSKSLDGGLTFVNTGAPPYHATPAADDGNLRIPGFCDGAVGHGWVGKDGTVYVPKGWCGQPWLAISHNEGATWTRVQVAGNGMPLDAGGVYDHEASVVTDSKNNIYYTWVANDRLPYLSISRDGGESWTKPMMIGPPGIIESSIPGMSIGADGQIAVVYMGSKNSPGPPYVEGQSPEDWLSPEAVAEKYQTTTWNGYITVTENALAKKPVFYTASVNDPKDPLIKGTCGPFRCQEEFDFLDIQIAPDGTAWASLVDGCITVCVRDRNARDNAADGIASHLVGINLRK